MVKTLRTRKRGKMEMDKRTDMYIHFITVSLLALLFLIVLFFVVRFLVALLVLISMGG